MPELGRQACDRHICSSQLLATNLDMKRVNDRRARAVVASLVIWRFPILLTCESIIGHVVGKTVYRMHLLRAMMCTPCPLIHTCNGSVNHVIGKMGLRR